jgi:hypothetical protein
MQRMRAELVDHVGGAPSATQRALIERAVNPAVRLAVMDERFAETKMQTDHDSRVYLAWCNTLTRTVRSLGLKSTAARTPSLAEYLAAKADAAA